jgi:hypothetical protein
MTSLALTFLFLFELVLGLLLLALWINLRDRMRLIEQRLGETLDEQDLLDFEERVGALLAQVREAGQSLAKDVEERRAALKEDLSKAAISEGRLQSRTQTLERTKDKLAAKLVEKALLQAKKPAAKKTAQKKNPEPVKSEKKAAGPSELPKGPQAPRPVKMSYLSREFRAPEPRPPLEPAATRYLKVYQMADQGFHKEEIAKACGYLPGEVELILNLRPRPRGK